MFSATKNIDMLKRELDVQARLLEFAPFHLIKTRSRLAPETDAEAISFSILVGSIRGTTTKSPTKAMITMSSPTAPITVKHNVWAQLYPVTQPGGHVEVHFHAYEPDDSYAYKVDPKNICARLSQRAKAYNSPGRSSTAKLTALSQYYFLRKLAESGSAADVKKLHFGVPVKRTFMEDLKAVCREFEE